MERTAAAMIASGDRDAPQGGAYRAPVDVNLSVIDIFTIGIGPSSSHTVGPMRAAYRFVRTLEAAGKLQATVRVTIDLFGSLALTGKGHATDIAILLGLSGERPSQVDPDAVAEIVAAIRDSQKITLGRRQEIRFVESRDLNFRYDEFLPEHSNGMTITAFDKAGDELLRESYFSVGGGYVVTKSERDRAESPRENITLPYGFSSGAEMLAIGRREKKTIAEMMLANEAAWRANAETIGFLDAVHAAMRDSIKRGCREKGVLPGGLNVPRRARKLYLELKARPEAGFSDPMTVLDWVNLFALAVNEENAAGGRVVTAPTNGAAG
ncbi:MAG: L-serine ammonia-lyase, partial [Hyphomicrobiales bacterium]|nr:L-serine ammonia-lyase [Hyphomicrobiales bacterium]